MKVEAQKYLERVKRLEVNIENKLIEQLQWKELAMKITANMGGEKVKSSGSQSKMADAVIKCLAAEEEAVEAVDAFIAEKKAIVKTIEEVYSPMECKILHLRYIQHISLNDIADKLKKDYSWVTTTHGRALKSVQNILNRSK